MPHSLKPEALEDLDTIYWQSCEAFGTNRADQYVEGLVEAFNFLGELPHAARIRSEMAQPIRAYRFKAHMILYLLGPDDHVIILRIRHGRTDWINDPL